MKINVFDETTAGARSEGPQLEFTLPKMTVRTLIETRIRTEADERYRDGRTARRLIEPDAAQQPNRVDVERQIAIALQAFDRGQLVLLLPNRQAESLDERLSLDDGDEVTFLRLVPLIGG